jgi:hypothetical protein
MRSAVAEEFIVKWPVKPDSVLAKEIASLIAKKTLDARNKGGSPMACKIKELYLIIEHKLLNKKSQYFARINGMRIGTPSEKRDIEFFWNVIS